MATPPPPPSDPEAAPRTIRDRYVLVRSLGEGTSGRTLLCDDLEEGRPVAIKELRVEHLESWKHLELFEREALVLSRLDHRAVPKVFDSFREGDDAPSAFYIVQEYVEGRSLQDRLDTGPMLGQTEVESIARQMLDVLDYLHRRAPPVLHRDIKPSNVLLRPDGSIALVDFGGVLLGWRPADASGATVVGTFGYMPPEQLMGQAVPASDLYALGATLLHAMTGRSPSEFSFDSGRIELPRDLPADGLVGLVDALLRIAPRDRPPSARAALELMDDPATAAAGGALPVGSRTGTAVTAYRERPVTVVADVGPTYVDLGPPPRDPAGPLCDVYRNLINPLFPAKRLWGTGMHVFWVGFATVGSVVSAGILPALYLRRMRRRKRAYEDLFRNGRQTEGVIRSAREWGVYAVVKYEFEVGGEVFVSFMEYAAEMLHFWNTGDRVPVLHDPDDPTRCCFVYR